MARWVQISANATALGGYIDLDKVLEVAVVATESTPPHYVLGAFTTPGGSSQFETLITTPATWDTIEDALAGAKAFLESASVTD